MEINDYGQVIVSEQEAIDSLYSGKILNLDNLFFLNKESVQLFNKSLEKNADKISPISTVCLPNLSTKELDKENQKNWFMPKDYCPDLLELLYGMCTTQQQTDRVTQELELFVQHNMMDLLHYLKYLVDTLRENKIVWGVGRGSSVASYVLYLIGVHKIDSIKYELDINEFLK